MRYFAVSGVFVVAWVAGCSAGQNAASAPAGYKLVWADEFDKDGRRTPPTGRTSRGSSATRRRNGTSRRTPDVRRAC